jgi:hypothetical protein
MKLILYIILTFIIFSCAPIRYISIPIKHTPSLGLLNKNRILIAQDSKFKIEHYYSDKCIEGLISDLKTNSLLNVIETIYFNQKVDSVVLLDLKMKYNLDGLLLLTDIDESVYNGIIEGFSAACVGCPKNYYYDFTITLNSKWEYFDFITGKTYGYSVENYEEYKWHYDLRKIEDYHNLELGIKEQMNFKNGQLSSKKLIEQ